MNDFSLSYSRNSDLQTLPSSRPASSKFWLQQTWQPGKELNRRPAQGWWWKTFPNWPETGRCHLVFASLSFSHRGLDIPTVQVVINHNTPGLPKIYIHRVGRTARAGNLNVFHSGVTLDHYTREINAAQTFWRSPPPQGGMVCPSHWWRSTTSTWSTPSKSRFVSSSAIKKNKC